MYSRELLKDRVILVTGGGSGLGLAMAEAAGLHGAKVAICGRDKSRLDGARQKLLAGGCKDVFAETCDVREPAQVQALFDAVSAQFGSPDILVNNAAGNFLCAAEDLTPNGFRSVVDIVLQGTFNCTHQFGSRLIAAKRPGVVLSIVTTYTQTGSAFVLPSACAKAGVYALTNSLAFEWACYGIRLNSIAPGPFPTEGAWSRLVPDPAFENTMKARVPLGRFGTPADLSNLMLFLVSDLSSYITGECVTVDGGEHLGAGQFNFIAQLMPREKLKSVFSAMRSAKAGK